MNAPQRSFSAVVLAGGRSTRMGADKAGLPHPDGGTLLDRQLRLLLRLEPSECFVSVRTGQPLPPLPASVRRVEDDGEAGPLGGIIAALQACACPRLLVVAVDLPRLDATTLRQLLATGGEGLGAVPHHAGGLEPLAAVYPRSWLPEAIAARQQGHHSLRRWLERPAAARFFVPMPASNPEAFVNWNEPGDFRA